MASSKGDGADKPDGLASCFGVGTCGGCAPKRSDSMPSPTARPSARGQFFNAFAAAAPASEPRHHQRQRHREPEPERKQEHEQEHEQEHDPVLFELTRVPPEDLARELTLIFLRDFQAIQPDELTSVAWSKRDKLVRAPNVVQFTLLFNRVNFWAQRCILDVRPLSSRAAVLAHVIKVGKRLLEHQNLHAAFAILAALQSQPIYRLRRTWALLSRKCADTFQRLVELFSAENNHDRLRGFLQVARLPLIPYLGLYMNDLVYIDTCYPSSGGLLESQARKDQMNNICRIISECQMSSYNFQSKEQIRRYLESQSYLEEMQSLVETANHSLSLELEPKQDSDNQLAGGQDDAAPLDQQQRLQRQALDAAATGGDLLLRVEGGDRGAVLIGHRKSKSVGDASGLGHSACHGSHATAGISATTAEQARLAAVRRNFTLRSNGVEIRKNLIDDSMPVSTEDCSTLSLSAVTPAVQRSEASSPGLTPLTAGGTVALATEQPASDAVWDAAGPRQLPAASAAAASALCHGPLERKAVFKRGRRQPRARYHRYWAELVLLPGSAGPALRLFAPCHRRLVVAAGTERRHFKATWKHQQPLSDASVVAVQLPIAGPLGGSSVRAFQINFDDQYDGNGRQHSSMSGLKFSSYKYRVCSPSRLPGPTRDDWVAAIHRAIDASRQEKALIDFNDAPQLQAAVVANSSSPSDSVEWTCL